MTTNDSTQDTRDEVLFAFHQACERPTSADILEWTRRYPQYAEEIRAHAAIARDWESYKGVPRAVPDESMLARGHSRVLNALYNAQVPAANVASEPCPSFQQLMTKQDTDVPRLARQLGIARSVLADLVNGGVLPPVGKRLVDALTAALGITPKDFDGALQRALNAPRLGPAKAEETPTLISRPYAEVVGSSSMSSDRIDYWLV